MAIISPEQYDRELKDEAARRSLEAEVNATSGTLREAIVPQTDGIVPVYEGFSDPNATGKEPVRPNTGVRPIGSRGGRIAVVGSAALMALAPFLLASDAEGKTYIVPAGGDVQAYIDSTTGSVGDTIELGPNVYTGAGLKIDPTGAISGGNPRGGLDLLITGSGPDLTEYQGNGLSSALRAYRAGNIIISGISLNNQLSMDFPVILIDYDTPSLVNCKLVNSGAGAYIRTTNEGTRMTHCIVTNVDIAGVVNYHAVGDTLPHLQIDSTSISRGTAYPALGPWIAYLKGWNNAVLTGEGNTFGEGDGELFAGKTATDLPILIDYNSNRDAEFRLGDNTYAEPYLSEIIAHGDSWNHAFVKDALDGQGTGRYLVASPLTWVEEGGRARPVASGRLVTPVSDGQLRFAKDAPPQEALVAIYGVNGRQYLEQQVRPGQVIDLGGLPPGGYLARILVPGQEPVMQKFVNVN
ncbi:MAG: hypothetical protein ABIK65_08245 [Candidatus Eisenbacteria bacterium]